MSGNYKGPTGLAGICPEVTQGTPNWDVKQKTGAAGTKTSIVVDAAAGAGAHDLNLASSDDDFFNGLYLYCKAGANAGEVKKITDYARVVGDCTFTTVAFSNNITDGDQFYIFTPLQASNVKVDPKTENLARDMWMRQTLDPPSDLKGLKAVSGSFDFDLHGLVQENGNGDTPAPDRLSQFLKLIGTRRSVAGQVTDGASSTTTNLDIVDVSSWLAADLLLVTLAAGSEVAYVSSVDASATPDDATVTPALSSAPASGAEVFQGEKFTPDESGHQSFTVLVLFDDQLIDARGCIFNLTISGQFGQPIKASVDFDGDDWDMQDSFTADGEQEDKKPVKFTTGRVHFGATELYVNSFEFTFGHGRKNLRDTNAGSIYLITERKATCKVVFRDTGVTPKETWEANGTQGRLLLQVGNTAGDCIAITGNMMIGDPIEMTDVEDHKYWDSTFKAVDDNTSAATAQKPLLARF